MYVFLNFDDERPVLILGIPGIILIYQMGTKTSNLCFGDQNSSGNGLLASPTWQRSFIPVPASYDLLLSLYLHTLKNTDP